MIELQDIFKRHGEGFLRNNRLNPNQLKAYYSILRCRTAALGAHVGVCDHCGYNEISYNSCRNRHCPKCQTTTKEQWIEKQKRNLLDIGYFHVVFTVPKKLHPVFYQNQTVMYNIFLKSVSETLLELGYDPKYLGAQLGITAVLHTWGQNLLYHPHIHCVVTGGGLTKDGRWLNSRKNFFIPIKVLSKKFRGKFIFHLRQAKLCFGGSIEELNVPACFDLFVSDLFSKDWVTYCKPPFKNASKVVTYLGRYTHRVAISNDRIIKLENDMVTFAWRDYKDSNKIKEMTLTVNEFLRRFMLHVLPSGFRKIRHYGILASRDKSARIALCKELTNTPFQVEPLPRTSLEILREMFGDDFNLCPCCGIGHLTRASPSMLAA